MNVTPNHVVPMPTAPTQLVPSAVTVMPATSSTTSLHVSVCNVINYIWCMDDHGSTMAISSCLHQDRFLLKLITENRKKCTNLILLKMVRLLMWPLSRSASQPVLPSSSPSCWNLSSLLDTLIPFWDILTLLKLFIPDWKLSSLLVSLIPFGTSHTLVGTFIPFGTSYPLVAIFHSLLEPFGTFHPFVGTFCPFWNLSSLCWNLSTLLEPTNWTFIHMR